MSTHLDPSLQSALGADGPLHGFALELLLPGPVNIRLLDGAGALTLNGESFFSPDPTYGALILPEHYRDGIAAAAPNVSFGLDVPSLDAAATLTAPANQGSTINFWYWAANRATGVAYTPYLVWTGAWDAATLMASRGQRQVRIDAESWFGPFNDAFDGSLLTNEAHQALWPGESGLAYVVDVQLILPWGMDTPRPALIRDMLPTPAPGAATSGGAFPGIGSIGPIGPIDINIGSGMLP